MAVLLLDRDSFDASDANAELQMASVSPASAEAKNVPPRIGFWC